MSDNISEQKESNNLKNAVVDSNVPLEDIINNYVKNNNPKIYILTPCYGGLCYINYVVCLMQTLKVFESYNVKVQVEFCRNDSLVSRARNNLVARAMADPKMTHIFFIDADISWDPIDILKLMVSNKQLIGGIYPLKHYDWDKLTKNNQSTNTVKLLIDKKNNSQFKNIISDENMVQYNMVRYNVNHISKTLTIEQNLKKVRHIATGFMMIQRNVIEKMSKAFPSTKYVDDVGFLKSNENEFAYALFDCGVEEGHYFSEDWLFCHRWSKMGGDIWIDISINLTHTGIEDFQGSYLASII